ncbi:hypothetical protein [Pseudomonas sp. HY2-MNA-CIBAN-0224]|uniref:hypothetical protein n=1 Tax=Pseudomonas sp. HY2-MNA-CIBAN-0224 TaxID=3140471 RepID=UPI00332AB2F0
MSGADDLARLTVTIDKANELFLSEEPKMVDVGGGLMRPTNAKVLADLATQMNGAQIYTSVALGLASTAQGSYFSVPSLESTEYLILYQNNAGAAKEIDRYPNARAVDALEDDLKIIADRSSDRFYNGKRVYSGEADEGFSASIVTLEDGSVVIPKLVLGAPALATIQDMIDESGGAPSGPVRAWPTTALGALAEAARRRVDFVMIGDSNQRMDGYGWGGGLMRALHNRFGCYATGVATQSPITMSTYTTTGESSYGLNAPATYSGAPDGVESVFPGFSFTIGAGKGGIGYAWLPAGESIANANNSGGVGISADHAIGASNKLRIHYDWVSMKDGAGQFRVEARLDGPPWTKVAQGPVTPTNTGEHSLHRQTLDIPAASRTTGLECKWFTPGGTPITGPFAAAWFRVENPAKASGVSVSTIYGSGGQSLYDMAAYLLGAPDQVLINWFGETRRLQLLAEQKPIVVVYVNSGLNDQNETLKPSLGWRESDSPTSPAAYIDNLEAIVKRVSDVWQKAGWDETELFFLVMPSHPISTPDASKLLSYRRAAKSFSVAQRISFIDLENITSNAEMLNNKWYKENNTDINHLVKSAYQVLGERVIALVPEIK